MSVLFEYNLDIKYPIPAEKKFQTSTIITIFGQRLFVQNETLNNSLQSKSKSKSQFLNIKDDRELSVQMYRQHQKNDLDADKAVTYSE